MLALGGVALGGLAVVVVAGCGSATQHSVGPMMGGGSRYHDSGSTCRAPRLPPGQVVAISVGDMGMTQMMGGTAAAGERMRLVAAPPSVRAGKVTLVVSNRGWRTHELVILPLAVNAQAGQRTSGANGRVPEGASVGEASKSCSSGKGEGITSGSVGWTTLSLPAGRYELICNLQNHYADGMHQELDVI